MSCISVLSNNLYSSSVYVTFLSVDDRFVDTETLGADERGICGESVHEEGLGICEESVHKEDLGVGRESRLMTLEVGEVDSIPGGFLFNFLNTVFGWPIFS
ncbi:hypothetical protein HHI36_017391, partial [Cryptolaemus montrouzieri]